MIAPRDLLVLLVAGAIGTGGVLQGLYWRSQGGGTGSEGLETALRMAQDENELLKAENQALRSLAQGGGEMSVPQELIDRVEGEFALEFRSTPVVHRIASEELRDRIAAATESRFGPSGVDDRQEAYELIGWLSEEDHLLAQLTTAQAMGARGWFDDVTGEAWVTHQFEIENIPDQAVLYRLLTRILLNQHFPPPAGYPGDDGARAREALHQGSAAGAETRFFAAHARAIGFMPMNQDPAVAQFFASLSPFLQGLLTFPGNEGQGFAERLFVQGTTALHKQLHHPPQTTAAILHPAEQELTPRHPGVSELSEASEEPYLTESGGMLGLRLWLQNRELSQRDAAAIADAWQEDSYVLIPDGEASVALVWDIEFREATAAERFLGHLAVFAAQRCGSTEPLALETITASSGQRFIKLSRPTDRRVRIVNSAARGTAERY